MIEYQDIENSVLEKSNMGGAWQDVYFAPAADFATFASTPSEDGDRTFAGMNMLSVGADSLKPGKKLFKAYNTLEKVSLDAEAQGEVDGMSYKIVLKMFTPGLTSTALAMLKIPNQNWIFYVRSGNQMFRVGGPMFAAKKAPAGKVGTGEKTSSAKGVEMEFNTYEDGFAPEVVDIDAILAMTNAVDANLTVVYSPAHGASTVLVDATPTITFAEAVVNADTLLAFTSQQAETICTLNSLDVDGEVVAAKPFTGVIAGNVITITPTTDFAAATMYELKIDATKVLSSDTKGRMNAAAYVRFTTA
jgi:hypothetical protein